MSSAISKHLHTQTPQGPTSYLPRWIRSCCCKKASPLPASLLQKATALGAQALSEVSKFISTHPKKSFAAGALLLTLATTRIESISSGTIINIYNKLFGTQFIVARGASLKEPGAVADQLYGLSLSVDNAFIKAHWTITRAYDFLLNDHPMNPPVTEVIHSIQAPWGIELSAWWYGDQTLSMWDWITSYTPGLADQLEKGDL